MSFADDKNDGASWPLSEEQFRSALFQTIGLAGSVAYGMA